MSYTDGLNNLNNINTLASSNYYLDPRTLICPTRSQANNYISSNFETIGNWVPSTSGTGSYRLLTPGQGGSGNSAQSYCIQFNTGATMGGAAWIGDTLPVLPVNYGICMIVAAPNSSNISDALWIACINSVNYHALVMSINNTGVYVQDVTGNWNQLTAHYFNGWCEYWIEVTDGTPATVSLYAGTQFVNSIPVTLPTAPAAEAGVIVAKQQSGVLSNIVSQIAQLNIGTTQLPDNMTVQWNAIAAPYDAQAVNLSFAVEDTCANIELNTDFVASLSINSTAFTDFPLTEITPNPSWMGIIDYTKPVRLFSGIRNLSINITQGQNVTPQCQLLNGKYGAVITMNQVLTSANQ